MDGVLVLIVLLAVYFLPAVVAAFRRHHNGGAILLTNLLLGWTGLGWIIALVWSVTATRPADGEFRSGQRPSELLGEGMSRPAAPDRARPPADPRR